MKTKIVNTIFITFALFVNSISYSVTQVNHFTHESPNHAMNGTGQKGSHRYGKIESSLIDQVYTPEWRSGRFVFRPGMQATSYKIGVRLFMDHDYFAKNEAANELAAETEFAPVGNHDDKSMAGFIPASKLLLLNNVPGILAVEMPEVMTIDDHLSPAPFAVKHSNPLQLEQAGVYDAWEKWGKGKGIKIGIIDGGFITLPMLLDSGILPKDRVHLRSPLPEEIQKQHPYGTGVHGASVLEVIHEIAPEADFYIYPTMVIPEMWEKAVLMAVEDDVHVINSSMNSTLGALDGIGVPNKYLDPAIEAGIIYVNSAGNYGAACYVSRFIDPDRNGWHNFAATDEGNTLFLSKGDPITISLLWDDFGSNTEIPDSDQDLDLYLYYVDPETRKINLVAKSENEQKGDTDRLSMPAERLSFPPEGAPYTGNYSVMIKAHRIDSNRTINMRIIAEAYDRNATPPNIYKTLQYSSRMMTMTKPADHPYVITVAACGIDGNVHQYSGTGPSENGVIKPDITGYSGLLTSSMQDPFWGTSCASPFVAACAALLRQQYKTAEEVKEQLKSRCITPPNSGIQGQDSISGWGIVSLRDTDQEIPHAKMVSISRVADIVNDGQPIGFNLVTTFVAEEATHDRLYTSLYFKDEKGNYIKASNQLGIYSNAKGHLRVAAYTIPNSNKKVAFESWMIVPNEIIGFVGEIVVLEMCVEDESNNVLDTVVIGTADSFLQY